jgi:hypothetical protein
MPSITNVNGGALPDTSKRSYITSAVFQTAIFTYVEPVFDAYGVIVTPGSLLPFSTTSPSGAAATGTDCPAKRVLRETGKKLFPGIHSGVNTFMVSVYDTVKGWHGYIDPNGQLFAQYSTIMPNFFANGVDAATGAPADAGAPVITNGLVNAGQSVTAGTYVAAGTYVSAGTTVTAGTGISSTTGDITATAGNVYGFSGIGYSSGGTGSQTSAKTDTVTINKPTGRITMSNATLASGATVDFLLSSTSIGANDIVVLATPWISYTVTPYVSSGGGSCRIYVRNNSGGPLSEFVTIQFAVIKGAIA